jgi:enoyl-CoA hydratase/carnithine racemase
VGGVCVGGGLELALACDLVVVADTAQLSEPHVTLHSFTAGEGLTNTLARLVGVQKAKELVLLGGTVDGHEAVRIGLANRVVPEGSLAAEAGKIAAAVAGLDPVAARMAKVLANAAPDVDRERGLRLDALVWSMQMTLRGGEYRGAVKFLAEREERRDQDA